MSSSPEPKDYGEVGLINIRDPFDCLDSFEDASEDNTHATPSMPQSSSTRSLTDRRLSNGSVTTPRAEHSPAFPPSPEGKPEDNDESVAVSPTPTPHSENEDTPRRSKYQKSPLLTAHRLSTTSLDDVNLAGNKNENELHDVGSPVAEPTIGSPGAASLDSNATKQSMSFLPSVPWSNTSKPAPAAAPAAPVAPPAPPPLPARKLTSPFSWLSRSSLSGSDSKSSPTNLGNSRRSTAASVSTINTVEEGDSMSIGSKKPARNSLKDQFKLLRMREEGPDADQASIASGNAPVSAGLVGPSEEQALPAPSPVVAGTGGPFPPVNPNLPPGTVSGISTSATDAAAPVDWELWEGIVNNGPEALTGVNSEAVNAAIKRGIPQTIRGVIWQVLADSRNSDLEEVYRELVARGTDKERHMSLNGQGPNGIASEKESLASSRSSIRSDNSGSPPPSSQTTTSPHEKEVDPIAAETARKKKLKEDTDAIRRLEKTIRRDLGSRTSYSKYFVSQGSQEALFGLCKAYALYDEAVGYAQGINFIAMPLLFNMDEGEAFTLLVKLMNKYGLRDMFIQDMPGLHLHLFQFERLLEDLEPALYCHLRRRGVSPQLYATQWFLTLFAYRFPLQLVLRIYDLIFEEGLESTILRFGVAIMRRNVETLLGMKDMSSLSQFLKERLFDVYIDQQPSASSILESGFFGSSGGSDKEIYRADLMVQDACAISLTAEMIQSYTAEWEEKVRTEREREQELETLKHTVASQAARIRSLEERTEKSDQEHVQLASELVRMKVENEELSDKNESLQVQVQELKIVVDKQPAEVEEKLRTEMERIMKRNMEVQNENRHMEEQMAEMEKDLVETKMKWAELSENHEGLRQKWADLRRALDG
ncbi:GTPase activating protein (Gyp5), putative [Talaromyces stipitatus ATCC 10500]|uniref:GTPase-activating protein GYP5 n=1 Tax=Talaromyces stipitatus (strain ATCC 10500 / CBS 375.48 / QM 6759 / NRRL 1006) TaxID=441959 RepID=B8LWQ5_TALSN|nr:GTPase activating protein (Gyp5), putative [Talaromyces stipitatus ATCC 10500]EED24452.1 GTPase activating protein (Gyp5), putative [Talaromyces stipitatus ATCC 10500]